MTAQRNRIMENTAYLEEALRALLHHGYSCYTIRSDDDLGRPSGFIITPDNSVLYVHNEYFGGWNFTYEYRQSREHGTGCQCLEQAANDVSLETVKRAEYQGKSYALRLKASLYSSPDAWKRAYWAKERLVPVYGESEVAGA
jgi:hypothetical protein